MSDIERDLMQRFEANCAEWERRWSLNRYWAIWPAATGTASAVTGAVLLTLGRLGEGAGLLVLGIAAAVGGAWLYRTCIDGIARQRRFRALAQAGDADGLMAAMEAYLGKQGAAGAD